MDLDHGLDDDSQVILPEHQEAAMERTRMALAEAGYPNATVTWMDWLGSPGVVTWTAEGGQAVPDDIAERAIELALR